jgi:hypothetical protein
MRMRLRLCLCYSFAHRRCCCCSCCCCCCQGESLDPTQTQGGPDSFVSGNMSRQQLAEKEAKFRVSHGL